MRKHRLFSVAVLAAFFAASVIITACGGLNNPSKPASPDEPKPEALQQLKSDQFPTTEDGKSYDRYKIEWTDAAGNKQTKVITADEAKSGLALLGGIKAGTTAKITPQVKNSEGNYEDKTDAATDETPSTTTAWKLYIKAGIDELSKEKPDYDAALAWFKDAYGAEKNNTTKAYYAVVQLASISVKQETVDFMQNKMGFATYPKKLNALVNLDWFKDETRSQTRTENGTISISVSTFSKSSSFAYKRVKGHIADTPDATKVSIPVNGNLARFEMGTVGPLAGKWSELGYNALLKKIIDTPLKDRKRWYSRDDSPDSGKYLIVDAFDDGGTYLVGHSDVDKMQGFDGTQGYFLEDWNNSITYDYQYEEVSTWHVQYPELKPAADWYKELNPLLQIPAYIIEHSDSAKVDQLIDELYGILFGKEFTNASTVLNSLDATKSVTINKQLIKRLGMSGEDRIFPEDTDVELQKEQLLGLIGSMTVAKGAFELVQSYSFNTDLNILKWNWEKEDEILKNLGSYNRQQDPFNNGFLKGRNPQKIVNAKDDIVKGADLLLAAYKSLTDSKTLPAKAKEELVKNIAFIQAMVKEIRDAVAEGRKANILIGENNPLAKPPVYPEPLPGEPHPTPVYLTKFEIDMGKVFTYEYFKLSNLFEMDGSKPKIYDANGSVPYMNLTLKRFMDDFVTVKFNNNSEIFVDFGIPLNNDAGQRIINFYK